MAKINADMVKDHAIENFKENLRTCISAGACLLSVDELDTCCRSIFEEVLSFLRSDLVRPESTKE